jgi:hypothetical protein
MWAEKGISGFTVFKYKLRRCAGQPVLTTEQVGYSIACAEFLNNVTVCRMSFIS